MARSMVPQRRLPNRCIPGEVLSILIGQEIIKVHRCQIFACWLSCSFSTFRIVADDRLIEWHPRLINMKNYLAVDWTDEQACLYIISTSGDGECIQSLCTSGPLLVSKSVETTALVKLNAFDGVIKNR